MPRIRSILTSAATTVGALFLAGGCRSLGSPTLMRHGFVEVRVRGPGIDTTCRADAYYRYAGLFDPSTSGWIVTHGWADDDPRWRSSRYVPTPWCGIMLRTVREPTTGATFRVGVPRESADFLDAMVMEAARPYSAVARAGVMHVDEATSSHVRGTFQLTLVPYPREAPAPPVTVEGRFEVSRNPVAER